MERKRTLTMNWDGLRDYEDDDCFFESNNRISAVGPVDLLSSSDEDDNDDDFQDTRMSFSASFRTNTIRAFTIKKGAIIKNGSSAAAATTTFATSPEYNIWMAAPGSIRERRKKLLYGMGLNENKESLKITSIQVEPEVSAKKEDHQVPLPTSTNTNTNTITTSPEEKKRELISSSCPPPPSTSTAAAAATTTTSSSSSSPSPSPPLPLILVRSRSDGDIDSFSYLKARKEEMIGKTSKQRLTRTYSAIAAPRARVCPYVDARRISPKDENSEKKRKSHRVSLSTILTNRVGAFFLIKNLDTGKEFIVNGSDEDGNWNKLSDLQTGKQLTMEEFEKCVGYSPVVKELMRRQKRNHSDSNLMLMANSYLSKSLRMSKRRGQALLKNIKGSMSGLMGDQKEREREQLQSATQDPIEDQKSSKNNFSSSSEWVKVRQSGKPYKDLSALHMCQEFQAHDGSIWAIRFSLDGHYLASAGEDKVIHVWEVQECEIMSLKPEEGSITPIHPSLIGTPDKNASAEAPTLSSDKKKKGKNGSKRGSSVPDYVHVPETVFAFSDKPYCSLEGHTEDVLDLSWSKSQLLLSSSMDKTVRLWDLESKTSLRTFTHKDYVTCIQFNPMDDNKFISGSLDGKVRLWSIPERKVVDWTDVHDMVTAVAFTPDGQGVLVGTHKGEYRTYSTADCKLNQESTTELKTKKGLPKKVTGFQFSPTSPSTALVTSADSRIRVMEGTELTHKYRGFKNTSSQIAASFSQDGRYVVCASEDSQVFLWRHEENKTVGNGKTKIVITVTGFESFPCKEVSVAISWPGAIKGEPPSANKSSKRHSKHSTQTPCSTPGSPTKEDSSNNNTSAAANGKKNLPPLPAKKKNHKDKDKDKEKEKEKSIDNDHDNDKDKNKDDNSSSGNNNDTSETPSSPPEQEDPARVSKTDSGISNSFSSASDSISHGDSPSVSAASNPSTSSRSTWSWFDTGNRDISGTDQPSAWGMVIVTAGVGGEIRSYQNFGIPRRIGR